MPHRTKLLISAPIRSSLAKRLLLGRSSYLTSAGLRPSVQQLLDSMTGTAVFVRNGRLDLLAANQPGYPEVPWRVITDMRNRVSHGYFDIDLDVV